MKFKVSYRPFLYLIHITSFLQLETGETWFYNWDVKDKEYDVGFVDTRPGTKVRFEATFYL